MSGPGSLKIINYVTQSKLVLLFSYHSPINRETGVGVRNNDFIRKASRLRRWWTSVPNNHLAQVWMLLAFIEQRGGGEEIK